jgi:hypothetical protein
MTLEVWSTKNQIFSINMGLKKFFAKLMGSKEAIPGGPISEEEVEKVFEDVKVEKTPEGMEEELPAEEATKAEKFTEETTHAMEEMTEKDVELGKRQVEEMRKEEEALERIDEELRAAEREEENKKAA